MQCNLFPLRSATDRIDELLSVMMREKGCVGVPIPPSAGETSGILRAAAIRAGPTPGSPTGMLPAANA